jgi:hypothetical protein
MPTTTSWNDRCELLPGFSMVKAAHLRGNLRRDNGPLSGLPLTHLGRSNALDDKGHPESADLCVLSSHDGMVVSRP